MEVEPGVELGDGYSIVEEIGHGSMGTVYRASQPSLGRLVAIRVLLPTLTTQQGFHERFQREAKAIASLRHSNIVPVLDYGEQDGTAYLVMELIEGSSVADHVGIPLGTERVVTILEPVAAALDNSHAQGITHGDIRPPNVLLDGDGRPMLADFGLLGLATDGKPLSGLRGAGGLQVGAPAYMAPEIANESPLSPATDLYALGVVAYELLTGAVPYSGDTPAAMLIAHVLQPLPPPRTRNPLLPTAVDEVLLKALAKNPAERYATANAFVAALATAARQEDTGTQTILAPVPPPVAAMPAVAPTETAPLLAPVVAPPASAATAAAGTLATAGTRVTGQAASGSAAAPPLTSQASKRASPAHRPALLAGLGGALLVLLIGIVALTHRGGTQVPPSVAKARTPVAALLPGPGVWRAAQAMHSARGSGRAVVLHDGRVLAMGGWGVDGSLADAELYDPVTGRWTVTGSMHLARRYFTATVLRSGRVLVAGGSGSEDYLADAEIYDPQTGIWTVAASMQRPRDQHSAVLLPNGTVLVAGGETTGTTPVNEAEIYDPVTGHWTSIAPMTAKRWDATATLLANGTVLVTGGGSASAEIYNPATDRWRPTGSMSTVRYRHTATLLPDHRVLVAGGETAFTALLNTAEIYNPRTGAWTFAGAMPHPHSRHTATLLPNGEVVVAGGTTGKDPQVTLESGTSSVDIFDPASNRWYAAGSMRSKRAEQGAAPLSGGRVLQIGGYTDQGSVTAQTEIYSPTATR